jgi:hypothetical protein
MISWTEIVLLTYRLVDHHSEELALFVPKTYEIGGGWGNTIQWFNYDKRRVTGWKQCKPRAGDILESRMESGKTGVFKFVEVEHCSDPHDMFFATVEDIGYKGEI